MPVDPSVTTTPWLLRATTASAWAAAVSTAAPARPRRRRRRRAAHGVDGQRDRRRHGKGPRPRGEASRGPPSSTARTPDGSVAAARAAAAWSSEAWRAASARGSTAEPIADGQHDRDGHGGHDAGAAHRRTLAAPVVRMPLSSDPLPRTTRTPRLMPIPIENPTNPMTSTRLRARPVTPRPAGPRPALDHGTSGAPIRQPVRESGPAAHGAAEGSVQHGQAPPHRPGDRYRAVDRHPRRRPPGARRQLRRR